MMPFAGGLDSTSNATLLFSLVAAAIYLFAAGQPPSLGRSAAKTLATALLALLAFVQGGPLLLVAALVVSALGDAFLSRDGEPAFLGGLASFLVAHVLYIVLFLQTGDGLGILPDVPVRGVLAIAMIAFAAGMLALLWRRTGRALRIPVAVYAVAIAGMGLTALTTASPLLIAGAILFMASDALLASGRFLAAPASSLRAWMRYPVWILYYLAQASITLAFLLT